MAFASKPGGGGNLKGRIAIAIGCTDGVGLAVARRLAENGAHVVVCSREQQKVDIAVEDLRRKELSVSGVRCNVDDPQDRHELIKYTVKKHKYIDILFNNVGVDPFPGPMLKTPEDAFDKTFDVNVKANFYLVREAAPYMGKRGVQGAVLFTSTGVGFRGDISPGVYAISKGTLFSFTRALMPELLEKNIRVNCLALGVFNTKSSEIMRQSEEMEKYYTSFVPMKRWAEPHEAAGIAAFLCSDDASFISGETLCVTGGAFSRL